jgi:hypothetical protein
MCSDWDRPTNESGSVAMTQWLGFITGYDAAIRPNLSDGSLNGEPIANLIVDTCKKNPKADLVSVAKYIATYIQKEISGEVSQPIILNRGSAIASRPDPSRPDPDSWLIVKDLTSNSCSLSSLPALARKPINEDVAILTSLKTYVTGGKAMKAMKDMVAAECGCEKGCTWELPR